MKTTPIPPEILLPLAPRVLEEIRVYTEPGVELSVMVIIGHRDPESEKPDAIVFGISAAAPDEDTARRALKAGLTYLDGGSVDPGDPRLQKGNLN